MIGQILTDIITGNANVTSILGYSSDSKKWHPSAVPQGVSLPAIAYKVLSIDSVDTKDDWSGIEKFRVQLDLFAKDYQTLNKLDGAVRAAMNTAEGTFSVTDYDDTTVSVDVGVSRHDETTDVFFDEAETYGRSTEYNVITNRTP